MIRVYIAFPFSDGPSGGGNQFLGALRKIWQTQGLYEDVPKRADVILFNSHHELGRVFGLRRQYPHKVFVHRVDGPVSTIRGRNLGEDAAIYSANAAIADATIFQSHWSRSRNLAFGLAPAGPETVILNAPSPDIFNRQNRCAWSPGRKTRLIAASWSANRRKGFDDLLYLDKHMDPEKLEITFVGNSPVTFDRIRTMQPQIAGNLAAELRRNDIYIAASRSDPCSNALLEALHCGLPALGFNDGGHPELIGRAGALYSKSHEMLPALAHIVRDYGACQDAIRIPTLFEVATAYTHFLRDAVAIGVQRKRPADRLRYQWAMSSWRLRRFLFSGG